jgi:hypothetical protein
MSPLSSELNAFYPEGGDDTFLRNYGIVATFSKNLLSLLHYDSALYGIGEMFSNASQYMHGS